MNIVYGAIAVIFSFVVAKYFYNFKGSKAKIFVCAFVVEFLAILVLGGIFYFFGWGFFSGPLSPEDIALKVFGLAMFLAVSVGLKAVNQQKFD